MSMAKTEGCILASCFSSWRQSRLWGLCRPHDPEALGRDSRNDWSKGAQRCFQRGESSPWTRPGFSPAFPRVDPADHSLHSQFKSLPPLLLLWLVWHGRWRGDHNRGAAVCHDKADGRAHDSKGDWRHRERSRRQRGRHSRLWRYDEVAGLLMVRLSEDVVTKQARLTETLLSHRVCQNDVPPMTARDQVRDVCTPAHQH